MSRVGLSLILLVLLVALSAGCNQVPPERFETRTPLIWTGDSRSEIMLARKYLDVFEDKSAKLTLGEIIAKDSEFQPAPSTIPVYPFTESAIWTRLEIQHQSNTVQDVYLNIEYSYFDHVAIYQMDPRGNLISQWHVGDTLPFYERPINDHSFVIPLRLQPKGTYRIYVQRKAKEAMFLVESLWHPEAYRERDRDEQLLAGLFYGAILVMLLYNLLLYASTREITYLLYCIYLSLHGLFLFTYRGFAFEYLWPDYQSEPSACKYWFL